MRQLAERDHLDPDGSRVRVSRNTLDRWIRAWRQGGFEALLPADRSTAQLRSPLELLELAAEHAEKAKTSVLIIDEAHLLTGEQLEEIRMLTNHDMDAHSPFACLLLGQPTLCRRLEVGTLAALDQRVGLRFDLDGMDLQETVSYVKHHLQLAGRSDPLFGDDALSLLHQTGRGIPRAVNNLAVQALVAAFADGKGIVDERAARTVITEVTTE